MIHTNVTSSLLVTCGHLLLCVRDVHHFFYEMSGMAIYYKVDNIFFNKYDTLPRHDASVCEKFYKNSMSIVMFW